MRLEVLRRFDIVGHVVGSVPSTAQDMRKRTLSLVRGCQNEDVRHGSSSECPKCGLAVHSRYSPLLSLVPAAVTPQKPRNSYKDAVTTGETVPSE